MGKDSFERPGHLLELEHFDEQLRVADLPTATAAHEASQLFLSGAPAPLGLLLERAEGSEVTFSIDDFDYRGDAQRADQLILEIRDAHVETEAFHSIAVEVAAHAALLETAPELPFLRGVAQTRQLDIEPLRTEVLQGAPDSLRTAHRDDGDALGVQIPTAAPGQCLERSLVAPPLDEHNGTQAHSFILPLYAGV
jgi:hypothetical protein